MKQLEIFFEKSNNQTYIEEYLINFLIDDLILDANNLLYKTDNRYNIINLKKEESKELISSFFKSLFSRFQGEEIVFFDQKKENDKINIKITYVKKNRQ